MAKANWLENRKAELLSVGYFHTVFTIPHELIFPGRTEIFAKPQHFRKLVDQLYKKGWVVYSKKPFAGPEQVLDYLGRYTHRVAVSNHRIKSIANGKVSFTYRDRSDGNKSKLMTIGAHEFIRRFLLHVFPQSYKKIRHFGFLASRGKKKYLAQIRKILNSKQKPSEPVKMNARTMFLHLTGIDLDKCPHCKHGTMCVSVKLPRMQTNKFPVTKLDSS